MRRSFLIGFFSICQLFTAWSDSRIHALKDQEIERWQWLWYASILVALLIGGLCYYYFRRFKNRLYYELEEKIAEIEKSELHRLELEREMNHRVKNNMQIVSSLLELKARNANNPDVKEALIESQLRLQSMQIAQKKILDSGSQEQINLLDYCKELTMILRNALFGPDCLVTVNGASFTINFEQAQAVGFVLHELIANSLKYAWEERESDKSIDITISGEEGQAQIKYKDNGKGLPNDFEVEKSKSFGMNFVASVVQRQLLGKLAYNVDLETEFLITFKRR